MEPNDALFDAINRGDIAAARDAISRGADLGARNILGMTPMELSVDLGATTSRSCCCRCEGRKAVSSARRRLRPRLRNHRGQADEAGGGSQFTGDDATAGAGLDGTPVQRRWRDTDAECRVPGV